MRLSQNTIRQESPFGQVSLGRHLQQRFLLRVIADVAGNVYVSGKTNTSIGGTGFVQLGTHGSNDLFVSKLNPAGVLLWTYQWGVAGANTQAGYGLSLDASSNLYIPCFTTGVIGTQFGAHGTRDLCLVQILAGGTTGWAVQIGAASAYTGSTSGGQRQSSIETDSAGNFYLAGASTGNIAGATFYGTYATGDNGLLAKVSSTGTVNWVTEVGGGSATTTQFFGLKVDSAGLIRVSGITSTFLGGTQVGSHGTNDALFAIFSNTGAATLITQLGVSGFTSMFTSLALDSAQNAYVLGATYGSIGTQNGVHGTLDLLITKYDALGNFVSANQWGNTGATCRPGYTVSLFNSTLFVPTYIGGTLGGTQYGTQGTQDGGFSLISNLVY